LGESANIPEPLLAFDDKAEEVQAALAGLDAAHARYRERQGRSGILPNTLEALRLEPMYHSNAIEGSTRRLRHSSLQASSDLS
jgi:hypothetical protein